MQEAVVNPMMYLISRKLLEIFLYIFLKPRFFGRENIPSAPYVIVPNHTSLLDPPLAGVACKKNIVHFMAKKELFDPLILGMWTRSVGCICVDRQAKSAASLKQAVKLLREGHVVCIFPEGTRSEDGSLQDAKRGVGFMIARAGVPVVPVFIEGSQEALPRGGKLRKGTIIDVYVGKPIQPEELTQKTESGKRDYEQISNFIMDRIAQVKNTWQ